jgi:hypothetical protein
VRQRFVKLLLKLEPVDARHPHIGHRTIHLSMNGVVKKFAR